MAPVFGVQYRSEENPPGDWWHEKPIGDGDFGLFSLVKWWNGGQKVGEMVT